MTRDHIDDEQRIAEAGRCSCGARIVRGFDDNGELVSVDTPLVDAATELLAHINGTRTYAIALQAKPPRGLVLWRRTRLDIKRRPPHFNSRTQVVIEHECTDPKGDHP